MTQDFHDTPVLALCGGVGGAKLALGLYRTLKRRSADSRR